MAYLFNSPCDTLCHVRRQQEVLAWYQLDGAMLLKFPNLKTTTK
jgi:hypothetical protein